jgi:hypothetical protein
MKSFAFMVMFILAFIRLASTQTLQVDSVSVDTVRFSDSTWKDGVSVHTRKSRDCSLSFILRGEGSAKLFVSMSLDSGKTWIFNPESLFVLNESPYPYGVGSNYKRTLKVRALGGDRSGVAFRVTARQSPPKISGWAKGLVAVVSPGRSANTTVHLSSSITFGSGIDGYSRLAKTYVDASGNGIIDDSSAVNDAYTLKCNTTVPAPGSPPAKVIIRGRDKNGVWCDPETLKVEFVLLIDAAYRSIAFQWSARGSGSFNHWMIGDIVSDDAEKGGETLADTKDLQDLREFKANTQNSIISAQWGTPFAGIFLANRIIDSLPAITMDAALRARYIAEAKFLRAWSYFILVKTFGDVPLLLHTLSFEGFCQTRTPKAQVWVQIETDLTEAASVLPEKSHYASADIARATKGAANALLVKAYIYQKKFAEAKALADTIISSGQYGLEPNYADNFTLAHENGIESVYEFQYSSDKMYAWSNDNPGQLISDYQGSRDDPSDFGGWGFDCPTQNLVNEFETGDPRKKATIVAAGDTLRKGTPGQWIVSYKYPNYRPTGFFSRKYLEEYQNPPSPMGSHPANWRAIRYSEVLLFDAEGSNEISNTADALKYLNMVRARVGLPAVTTTDKDSLRNAIYHERRVELAMEGHRFWDVVRQGRGAAVLGSMGFVAGKSEVFAVPKSEIDTCSKLTQNAGY